MHILPGAVEHIHVHHFAHPLTVQRAVPVGHHKALGVCCRRDGIGQELLKLRLAQDAPHLQEQRRHGAHTFAFQHQGRVLPAAILFYVVDVLICQIHAAGKAHLAINDQNFAVVAVVVVRGNKGRDRREHLALDAQRFQPAGVIPRQGGELAGAVIHHPHIHPLRCLAGQHFQNAAPHQAFVHDEIFQKDVLFCRFQLAQHFIEHGFAAVEVGGHRVGIDRKAAALAPQIPCQRHRFGCLLLQKLHGLLILRQPGAGLSLQIQQAVLQGIVAHITFGVPEQRHAQHRHQCRDYQPCDAHAVVHVLIEQIDHHCRCYQQGAAKIMRQQPAEPLQQAEQRERL